MSAPFSSSSQLSWGGKGTGDRAEDKDERLKKKGIALVAATTGKSRRGSGSIGTVVAVPFPGLLPGVGWGWSV